MQVKIEYELKEKNMSGNKKGYIYIMTNPALINMVKIGYATNVEERRKQLSTTALPYEYEVYATYETNGNLEDKKLHQLIDDLNSDLRVSKNREFYVMTPEQAYRLLEAIAIISGTSKKLRKIKQVHINMKRPPIDFFKCGIPKGAELIYTEDPNIKVMVANNHKVKYQEELTSLTAIVKQLKGYKHVSGSSYFTYNGKLITEIADETQWKKYRK